MLRLRVLSWNLGPGSARWQDLAAVLAGWEWDVAALRGLPPRWTLPLTRSLDAEFRYAGAGAGDGSRVRRWLSRTPSRLAGSTGGPVDAVLARRDRVVAEWPADGRRAPGAGVHIARLACGIWVGNQRHATGAGQLGSELSGAVGEEALVLGGPRSTLPASPETETAPGRTLTEVARGGEDGIWVTDGLVAVSDAQALAGGAVGGNPPLVVTLEYRVPAKRS